MAVGQNCESCGAALGMGASFCRDCGASVRSVNDGECRTCGSETQDDAQFCGGCGTNLISGEAYVGAELPMMGFGEAISRGFCNYFTFSGRATRAGFWWWVLFTSSLGLIPSASLVTLIPTLAVTSRRLHDIGKSGWLQIMPWAIVAVTLVLNVVTLATALFGIGMIAAFASFVVLIVWLAKKGDEGPNKYGPDPRQAASQQPYTSLFIQQPHSFF